MAGNARWPSGTGAGDEGAGAVADPFGQGDEGVGAGDVLVAEDRVEDALQVGVVARDHPDVEVVELGARISPEGRFSWTAGGYQVRSDGLHLTPSGVQGWIAPWLLPQLVAAVPD